MIFRLSTKVILELLLSLSFGYHAKTFSLTMLAIYRYGYTITRDCFL